MASPKRRAPEGWEYLERSEGGGAYLPGELEVYVPYNDSVGAVSIAREDTGWYVVVIRRALVVDRHIGPLTKQEAFQLGTTTAAMYTERNE